MDILEQVYGRQQRLKYNYPETLGLVLFDIPQFCIISRPFRRVSLNDTGTSEVFSVHPRYFQIA